MKLAALMLVRNEDWVLGLSARVSLEWCDLLVVGEHRCCDDTEGIVNQLAVSSPDRISVLCWWDREWREMEYRGALLNEARRLGATHIAMIDADEILTGNLLPRIRALVEATPAGCILNLPGYNLRNGIDQYHSNGIWGNRWFSVAFRDDPRLYWSGDRFHHREPMGLALSRFTPLSQTEGGVMHLWGASERRLKAKHAWYKMTERLRWPEKSTQEIDRQYNQAIYPNGADWTYAPVPDEWWAPYAAWVSAHLKYEFLGGSYHASLDAEPWQERECREMWKEYGAEKFAGLDLFGVVDAAKSRLIVCFP